MLKTFIDNYMKTDEEARRQRTTIQEKIIKEKEKIARIEKRIGKLQKEEDATWHTPSWVKAIVEPLAQVLADRMGGKHFDIYGPFGLRHQTSIYLFDDPTKSITEQETYSLSIVPGDLKVGELFYETGEIKGRYGHSSLGDLNGMNNVTAPLPTETDAILSLLRKSGGHHEQETA